MTLPRLFLAALLALTAVFAHAQNFTTLDGTTTTSIPFTTPMELYRPFFGKGYAVHLPLTSSWRLPNGDNIDVGADGAVYRNALRLNTRVTNANGTITVSKNVCAEIIIVGSELYCRSKSDATKTYRWNNALTRWEASPADAYAPLLALPPNPSLPSTTSAEPRTFVAFPSTVPADPTGTFVAPTSTVPAPAPTSTWQTVAQWNGAFTVTTAPLLARFGNGDTWTTRVLTPAGDWACNEFVFAPDPALGVQKHCEAFLPAK